MLWFKGGWCVCGHDRTEGQGWRCQFRQTAHSLKFWTCHGLRRFSNLLKSAAERGENERVECPLTVKAKLVSLGLGLRTLAGKGEDLLHHYTLLGVGPVPWNGIWETGPHKGSNPRRASSGPRNCSLRPEVVWDQETGQMAGQRNEQAIRARNKHPSLCRPT